MNCTICVAKTRALISFAVTAKLICAFVFVYADCLFSHAAAHVLTVLLLLILLSQQFCQGKSHELKERDWFNFIRDKAFERLKQ